MESHENTYGKSSRPSQTVAYARYWELGGRKRLTTVNFCERTRQRPIAQDIKKASWIGHTLRNLVTYVAIQALDLESAKRKLGRPKQTWRRSIISEADGTGRTWKQVKKAAQKWVQWRGVNAALCWLGAHGSKSVSQSVMFQTLKIWSL